VAAPVYATAEEYAASPYGKAAADEADLTAALAIASRDVDDLLVTAVYDTDESQKPTDADVAEAMREATIAQASYTIDPGAHLAEGEIPAGYTSVSLGSASMTRSKAAPEVRVGGIAYHPRVWSLLRQGGLTGVEPWPGC
jgi:hypothetical protein